MRGPGAWRTRCSSVGRRRESCCASKRLRRTRRSSFAGHPAVRGLISTADSQKGGSIEYGMAVAAQDRSPNHVVVFTDADLSTHLGQLGNLIEPILRHGHDSAVGSRREPLSVVIKSGARNARGKLFIYLWKRLIPQLSPIIDTQCGFKAFRASVAEAIVRDTIEKRFAFDIELLLQTELARPGSIARVPIAWIDSKRRRHAMWVQSVSSQLRRPHRVARPGVVGAACEPRSRRHRRPRGHRARRV